MSAQNEDGEWDFVTQQVLAGATDKRNKDASIIWNLSWNLEIENEIYVRTIYEINIFINAVLRK